MKATRIWTAHARVTDKVAMRKLLKPLPDKIAAETWEAAAVRGRQGMRYDAATQKAFLIKHAGNGVLHVFTFDAITSMEVATGLYAAIDKATPVNMKRLRVIYAEVTGHAIEPIGTRH
jgi:hypothetical protein